MIFRGPDAVLHTKVLLTTPIPEPASPGFRAESFHNHCLWTSFCSCWDHDHLVTAFWCEGADCLGYCYVPRARPTHPPHCCFDVQVLTVSVAGKHLEMRQVTSALRRREAAVNPAGGQLQSNASLLNAGDSTTDYLNWGSGLGWRSTPSRVTPSQQGQSIAEPGRVQLVVIPGAAKVAM